MDPVSFRDLQTIFPDLDGWEKAEADRRAYDGAVPVLAGRSALPERRSAARDQNCRLGIQSAAVHAVRDVHASGYEKETSTGYEKSTTVGGQPGWEKWNIEGKDGEVNAFVAKRFILTVQGRNVEDIKVLHDVVGKLDLARLAAMK